MAAWLIALVIAGAHALPGGVKTDEWTEISAVQPSIEQLAEQSLWSSARSGKTFSVTLDANIPVGSKTVAAKVCVEVTVPEWMMDECVEKGLQAVFNQTNGQSLDTVVSKLTAAAAGKEIDLVESACDRAVTPHQLFSNSTTLPIVGTISVAGYTSLSLGSTGLDQFIESHEPQAYNELVEAVWWGSIFKKETKIISMDVDVTVLGGLAATGSICLQGTVPKWVPTNTLKSGLQTILNNNVVKDLKANVNGKVDVEPDQDTELVAENKCDQKENPNQLFKFHTEVPFLGKIGFTIYAGGQSSITNILGGLKAGR